ncbi:hypothetical protein [Paenibacillus sp. R14(2021)]|uniref:hypothetical protein n=1 Tax=Paenibacillus sp. R14(2021) TaxID=2859228 RepID=UPI001C615585|nr:hypothetical protein [Paenibacillus sp. R14(2021)]
MFKKPRGCGFFYFNDTYLRKAFLPFIDQIIAALSEDDEEPTTRKPEEILSGDKNIISFKVAKIAAFFIYGIKFLSKPNDKNLTPLPKLTRT